MKTCESEMESRWPIEGIRESDSDKTDFKITMATKTESEA